MPTHDEGRDRDSRGEVEVKRSMMWEFPTAMNQSKAMKRELWVEITPKEWRSRIKDPMKGALGLETRGKSSLCQKGQLE